MNRTGALLGKAPAYRDKDCGGFGVIGAPRGDGRMSPSEEELVLDVLELQPERERPD